MHLPDLVIMKIASYLGHPNQIVSLLLISPSIAKLAPEIYYHLYQKLWHLNRKYQREPESMIFPTTTTKLITRQNIPDKDCKIHMYQQYHQMVSSSLSTFSIMHSNNISHWELQKDFARWHCYSVCWFNIKHSFNPWPGKYRVFLTATFHQMPAKVGNNYYEEFNTLVSVDDNSQENQKNNTSKLKVEKNHLHHPHHYLLGYANVTSPGQHIQCIVWKHTGYWINNVNINRIWLQSY